MRSRTTLAFLSLAVIFLLFTTGCAHNNAMFFGTNTAVGLDARADPAAGGTPTVSIGYRRQEAVWMPLLANQANAAGKTVPGSCADQMTTNPDCHFQGTDGKDTYSVLASFGTKTGASAGTEPEARLEIAQYFATGWAARYLAKQGGAELVAIQHPNPEVDPTKVAKIIKEINANKQKVLKFVDDTTGKVDKAKLDTVLKGTFLENVQEIIDTATQPIANLDRLLTNFYFNHVDDLAANVP
ncbi:MAG: hypothetical protein DHS20C17_32370 [Cyclobacteriaceae bacterium]|nr:MAG: hypothetical protein DHS20C17_32370 [Cyclobacteriaceae bacterium]